MRLHLRKAAEAQVKMAKDTPAFPSLDWHEQEVLEAASEDQAEVGLGRMVVIVANLLEIARRSDPAYGLPVAQEVSPGLFVSRRSCFGSPDPADREQSRRDRWGDGFE